MALADTGVAATGQSPAAAGSSSGRASSDSGPATTPADASDDIQLTFLIPSNERHTLALRVGDSVQHAKQTLLDGWPAQFGAAPTALSELKFLYGGSYLDNAATLDAVKRYPDAPTVVHLMISRNKAQDKEACKDIDKTTKCTCIIL
ncbi:hypothetical protein LPJ61_003183 [Coemansia biformis]|uniref:UBL3-like ubiquitin domain-containing protein n=1 Tax=Coemansia biformis TaxID=1286918 RepID=A0A9W8CYV7_9FUNG|nr:hypothetical protein LPJ61_003183 [Coemansia biformis]